MVYKKSFPKLSDKNSIVNLGSGIECAKKLGLCNGISNKVIENHKKCQLTDHCEKYSIIELSARNPIYPGPFLPRY